MSQSSFLGADRAPTQAEGRDVDALGPSDSSDSGSDIQGSIDIDAADELGNIGQADHLGRTGDSDAGGTGERGSAMLGENIRDGDDILPDHIDGDEFDGESGLDMADLQQIDDLSESDDSELTEDDDETATPRGR